MQAMEKTTFRLERMDPNKLGMLLFLGGEVVFFGCLIIAYIYFRGQWDRTGGPTADVLPVGATSFFTVALLSSSVTIWLAERSLRRGNPTMMRWWLFATVALGVLFLLGQVREYLNLFDEGITIRTGLFGTTFFTLTGFHGLHVFGGLIMLAILFWLALAGGRTFRSHHSAALESVSLYWHFVDVVWIAVFSIVYLWALF